jgi:hypothetical protein
MRTYVFTDRERKALESWLRGERVPTESISPILSRIRSFNRLREDIDLWQRAWRRLKAKPSKAAST